MQTGDVILAIGDRPVSSVGDIRTALVDARKNGRSNVLMRVKSGDAMRFIALPVGKA